MSTFVPDEHDRRRIPSRAEHSASGTPPDVNYNGNNGNSNEKILNSNNGNGNEKTHKDVHATASVADADASVDGKERDAAARDPNANVGNLNRQLKSRHV